MTELSYFWTTSGTGDGSGSGYSSANLFDIFRMFAGLTNNSGGVAPDYLHELEVTGTSSPVAVASGAAIVYGIPYTNSASVNVSIPTPSSSTRIDRIVLRADWSAQTVRITRIAGVEGAGAAPSMTQSAGSTWDIPLATVSITTAGTVTVTDAREWLTLVGDAEITAAKIADNNVSLAKLPTQAQATVLGRASGAGTGVPSALTVAQLIAILATGDGAGSGLDADTVDGVQAAAFALLAGAAFTGDVTIGGTAYGTARLNVVDNAEGVNAFIGSIVSGRTQGLYIESDQDSPYVTTLYSSGTSAGEIAFATGVIGSSEKVRIKTNGQVGIGTTTPATNALLDLTSTSSALLVPRMTTAQRDAMTPTNGMIIYNTTVTAIQVYQNGAWVSVGAVSNIATSQIADSAITTAKIADSAVTAAKIADGTVTAAELASNAVTTAKIADSNVTTAKIADSNVTTAKIADSNVTTSKIADNNVTLAKLPTQGQATVLGRSSGAGTGVPTVLSVTNLIDLLGSGDGSAYSSGTPIATDNINGVFDYRVVAGLVHVQGSFSPTTTISAGIKTIGAFSGNLPDYDYIPLTATIYDLGSSTFATLAAWLETSGGATYLKIYVPSSFGTTAKFMINGIYHK